MGAQLLDFPVPTTPARPAGPRLVLVPAPAPEPTFHLTRRGRVVVSLLVAMVLTIVALAAGGQLASATGEPRTVTVTAGQTLSEIADRELPELSIAEGIVEIQLANGLSTDQVHAGQRLLVPNE